jgi:hypothetical protein
VVRFGLDSTIGLPGLVIRSGLFNIITAIAAMAWSALFPSHGEIDVCSQNEIADGDG